MIETEANRSQPAGKVAPCRFLRSRAMYVFDDTVDEDHAENEATSFWCCQTMKGFGPDDGIVGRLDCRLADRPCYEPR